MALLPAAASSFAALRNERMNSSSNISPLSFSFIKTDESSREKSLRVGSLKPFIWGFIT